MYIYKMIKRAYVSYVLTIQILLLENKSLSVPNTPECVRRFGHNSSQRLNKSFLTSFGFNYIFAIFLHCCLMGKHNYLREATIMYSSRKIICALTEKDFAMFSMQNLLTDIYYQILNNIFSFINNIFSISSFFSSFFRSLFSMEFLSVFVQLKTRKRAEDLP